MIDVLLETLLTLGCNRVPRQQGCFYFGDDADFDISSTWLELRMVGFNVRRLKVQSPAHLCQPYSWSMFRRIAVPGLSCEVFGYKKHPDIISSWWLRHY
jgi:hypothetical protein